MNHILAAVVSASALISFSAPVPARADALTATLGQPLVEVSHTVDVRIEKGVAIYKVRRTIANAGTLFEEATLDIALPHGAAATGLRIRSRDRWYDGELMEREKAARMYENLTGLGPHKPRDPALLEWVWPDVLELFVFPVTPGGTSTVEYTLTVPTRYRKGMYVVTYPRPGLASDTGEREGRTTDRLAPVVLTVSGAEGADALTMVRIDGKRVAIGEAVVLGPAETPEWAGKEGLEPDAGWAASRVEVTEDGEATAAKVDLAITHTYRNDIQVELVSPGGKRTMVRPCEGGAESDIKARFDVKLPGKTKTKGTWWLVVSDHAGRDVGTLDRWTLTLEIKGKKVTVSPADLPVFVPDAPEGDDDGSFALLEIAPPSIDTLDARLGRLVVSAEKGFLRLDLDAAPVLRPLPKNLSVVFVLDASHSAGPTSIDAQIAVARAYLSHVPDAHFEIVAARRRAERLAGSFAEAAKAGDLVAAWRKAGKLAPGNGSALDAGLGAAAAALKGRKGPAMIVALTDELLRSSFTNALASTALAGLPAGTVVHVVRPFLGDEGGEVSEARDDAHALAPIASAHGGIFLRMEGLPGKPSALRERVLGLVRPVRIDHFAVEGAKAAGLEGLPDMFYEGTSYRAMVERSKPPASLKLVGKIWAAPFARVVKEGADFTRATAAWVFSEDHYDDLTREEMLKLAFFGRAVTPVTSYLAIEPGTRPSLVGIDRARGGSGSGSGAGYGTGRGFFGEKSKPPDLRALLAAGVKACAAKLAPPAGWKVSIGVETTYDEVVDVEVRSGGPAPLAACIVEAAWAVRLTAAFREEREWYELELPAS